MSAGLKWEIQLKPIHTQCPRILPNFQNLPVENWKILQLACVKSELARPSGREVAFVKLCSKAMKAGHHSFSPSEIARNDSRMIWIAPRASHPNAKPFFQRAHNYSEQRYMRLEIGGAEAVFAIWIPHPQLAETKSIGRCSISSTFT